MSAPDPTVKTPDATANSGCGVMPCSQSDHHRATVIRLAKERGEFFTDVDGFLYWWPSTKPEHSGHLSAFQLRILADELDRANGPWDAQITEYFDSENADVRDRPA